MHGAHAHLLEDSELIRKVIVNRHAEGAEYPCEAVETGPAEQDVPDKPVLRRTTHPLK